LWAAAKRVCHYTLLAIQLSFLLLAGTARGTEYFVATNGLDTGANDGKSWGAPFLTISNAVAQGDVTIVTVSNGTYNIGSQILITNAITVRSFGNGVTGGLANASSTVIDAGDGPRGMLISNTMAYVDGFTIQRGEQPAKGGMDIQGGGVWLYGGVLQNCIVQDNNGLAPSRNYNFTQGGGIYITGGGTVSNCVIRRNIGFGPSAWGGGVYMNSGLLTHCQVYNNMNYSGAAGAGVYMTGGTTRNCLMYGNSSDSGGGVYVGGGALENCTIVTNSAASGGNGGGVYLVAGTVSNSIVYFNTVGGVHSNLNTTTGFGYSCFTNPATTANGNISGDPLFKDTTEGNYQLNTGSPCLDAGDNSTVTAATDLAGKTRIQAATAGATPRVDMGACEYESALHCTFVASPRYLVGPTLTDYQCFGPAPFQVQFTGSADGTNTTDRYFRWDFNGDGSYEQEGLNLTTASYTFASAGLYTPTLQVTNTAGEVASAFKTNCVSAGTTHYVLTSSPGALAPYTNWATAANNNIQAAVDEAHKLRGAVVIISNGTYTIGAQISVTNAITLRSFMDGLSGASNTVVQASGAIRVFSISNPHASIAGLTIQKGLAGANDIQGLGVKMSGGLVRDCIIQDNNQQTGWNHIPGGGVYVTGGGTVSNCVIQRNFTNTGSSSGGGVWVDNGLITHCRILNNTNSSPWSPYGGGGVYMNGASATLRNCLLAGNSVGGGNGVGGGVHVNAGVIENCTVVTNSASTDGAGVYRVAGTVSNSIVYFNYVGGVHSNLNTTVGLGYSCSINPGTTANGNITDDPCFEDAGAGDYRLRAKAPLSPCIDAGANQTWMTGAKDLAGVDRVLKGGKPGLIVDMGAYETYVAPAGTVFMFR